MRRPAPPDDPHAEIAALRTTLERTREEDAAKERELERYAADLRAASRRERQRSRELRDTYTATVRALSNAVEARDAYTAHHAERVAAYGAEIAAASGLALTEQPQIEYGFLLHDIGKIGIADAILFKPGALDPRERREMQRHPVIGEEIIREIEFLAPARAIVRHHHERWDGAGYPDGLAGEQIPFAARVFALADALDAITSDRPYRAARPFADARARCARATASSTRGSSTRSTRSPIASSTRSAAGRRSARPACRGGGRRYGGVRAPPTSSGQTRPAAPRCCAAPSAAAYNGHRSRHGGEAAITAIAPNIELRHLRAFVVAAEELHFTRAADRLHLRQQGLSAQIQHLERELGVSLFQRTTRSVALTKAGETLRDQALQILRAVEDAVTDVRERAALDQEVVTICYTPTVSGDVLRAVLEKAHEVAPEIRIGLCETWTPDTVSGSSRAASTSRSPAARR